MFATALRRFALPVAIMVAGAAGAGSGRLVSSFDNQALPVRVGHGADNEAVWQLAYEAAEGREVLGQPINTVHRWADGCIQNFAIGGRETGALMSVGCGPMVYAVYGARWQYLQQKFGAEAAFVVGYPQNNLHKWEGQWGYIWAQDFAGGSRGPNILVQGWPEQINLTSLYGPIKDRYLQLGGPGGELDIPAWDTELKDGYAWLSFKSGKALYWDLHTGKVGFNLPPASLPAVGPQGGVREQRAVSWAMAQIGQTHQPDGKPWNGWCDRFVANAFGKRNSGYHSAYQHWQRLEARGLAHPGDRNVPYGALAFYGPVPRIAEGHVQLSIGNGGFITTAPTIREASINEAGNYLGWAYADPEWPGRP